MNLRRNNVDDPDGPRLQPLTGWGRFPIVRGRELRGEDLEALSARATLSRGLGRSYGDASLPASEDAPVLCTIWGDRLLSFDPETGKVRAEAGLSLVELHRILLPRGFFSPVTPGTQHVTLGGMVAADVHGKNHHVSGCFGAHVEAMKLRVADGRVLEVTRQNEPELFKATLGGMGLTGHILEVQFCMERIPTPWIQMESQRVSGIDELVDVLKAASQEWPFTVAWADCLAAGGRLGRGIVQRGRWAEPSRSRPSCPTPGHTLSVPASMPGWLVAPWSMRPFNSLVYHRHGRRIRKQILSPYAFFYPLDRIGRWNLLYGRRGFTQYQCVLPTDDQSRSCRELFEIVATSSPKPALCVIKDCGPEGDGMLSFPRPGISIALDLAIDGPRTRALVHALNERVIELGGRIYLAKDALTSAEHYRAMDPRLPVWEAVRRKWDPDRALRSAQSVRLFGDAS